MKRITQDTTLTDVERLLIGAGPTIDFETSDDLFVWDGIESASWTVEGVRRATYGEEEDRIELLPEGDYFICEIQATREEDNGGPVECWSVSGDE